jgi:hypothetical protein
VCQSGREEAAVVVILCLVAAVVGASSGFVAVGLAVFVALLAAVLMWGRGQNRHRRRGRRSCSTGPPPSPSSSLTSLLSVWPVSCPHSLLFSCGVPPSPWSKLSSWGSKQKEKRWETDEGKGAPWKSSPLPLFFLPFVPQARIRGCDRCCKR